MRITRYSHRLNLLDEFGGCFLDRRYLKGLSVARTRTYIFVLALILGNQLSQFVSLLDDARLSREYRQRLSQLIQLLGGHACVICRKGFFCHDRLVELWRSI